MTATQAFVLIRSTLSNYSSSGVVDDEGILGLMDLIFDDVLTEQHTTFAAAPTVYGQCWFDVADEFVLMADTLQAKT